MSRGLTKLGRIVYNILPYYLMKKLVLKWTGDGCYLRFKHGSTEISGRCMKTDLGEFVFVGDKETFLKKKEKLEQALKKTQAKIDELEETQ